MIKIKFLLNNIIHGIPKYKMMVSSPTYAAQAAGVTNLGRYREQVDWVDPGHRKLGQRPFIELFRMHRI